MEVMQVLHMNKGEGETSYAKNCTVQKQIISLENSIMHEAVVESLSNTQPASMGIADLGCSSGPNTMMVISDVISTICITAARTGVTLPELRLSLNDLPGNDFNDIFMSLPAFYDNLKREKGIGAEACFVSGVAGSFYGRLFPTKSLHFVHSSSSLHWLSQGLVKEEQIDSFNAPYYAPHPEEVRNVIEEESSFTINHLEEFEVGWDGDSTNNDDDYELDGLTRGQKVAKIIRAVVESMLESHFGIAIVDELFRRYGDLVDDYFSRTRAKHINLVISLTRK